MKKTVVFLTSLLMLLSCNLFIVDAVSAANSAPQKAELIIQSAPALHPLMSQWVKEYLTSNPGSDVRLLSIPESATTNYQGSTPSLTFVSEEMPGGRWHMIVGKEAFVPIYNINNPLMPLINAQGVSAASMAAAFTASEKNWRMLVSGGQSETMNFYMLKSGPDISVISSFLGVKPELLRSTFLDSEAELIAKVAADPKGIAFSSMSGLMAYGKSEIPAGIGLLPIDKNANGRLDYAEQIYSNPQDFLRGAWIGKYPKALCRNIYCTAPQKPVGDAEVAFLTWALGAGQDILTSNAYVDLAMNDRQNKIDDLKGTEATLSPTANSNLAKWLLIALGAILLMGIGITELSRYFSQRKKTTLVSLQPGAVILDEKSVEVLDGLYFDKSHTWSFMEKNGVVRIGIDDFMQHITGPLTKIKMKKPGDRFEKGETFLSIIQNGKQLNINAPFTGMVRSQNSLLLDNTHLLNKSPYSEGWVYLVEPQNWSRETSLMLMADRYKEWLKSEFTRLKDFLAVSLKANHVSYSPVVLQDGGALIDHVLAELGPEVWEDFQTSFLDKAK